MISLGLDLFLSHLISNLIAPTLLMSLSKKVFAIKIYTKVPNQSTHDGRQCGEPTSFGPIKVQADQGVPILLQDSLAQFYSASGITLSSKIFPQNKRNSISGEKRVGPLCSARPKQKFTLTVILKTWNSADKSNL